MARAGSAAVIESCLARRLLKLSCRKTKTRPERRVLKPHASLRRILRCELGCDAPRVRHLIQRLLAALLLDGAAARIGPHDDRKTERLSGLAHVVELDEVVVLSR